jgi:hypothetical protein
MELPLKGISVFLPYVFISKKCLKTRLTGHFRLKNKLVL